MLVSCSSACCSSRCKLRSFVNSKLGLCLLSKNLPHSTPTSPTISLRNKHIPCFFCDHIVSLCTHYMLHTHAVRINLFLISSMIQESADATTYPSIIQRVPTHPQKIKPRTARPQLLHEETGRSKGISSRLGPPGHKNGAKLGSVGGQRRKSSSWGGQFPSRTHPKGAAAFFHAW